MRLDINYRKVSVKNTNIWRLNNTLFNNQEVSEEIKEEIRKYLETKDSENTTPQKNCFCCIPMGCSKSSSKREVYSNTILPQETGNISNKKPNITPKAIRERTTTTTTKKKTRKLAEGKKS